MTYTRNELLSLKNDSENIIQEVNQNLFDMLHQGDKLTLTESRYICLKLKTLRDEKGERPFKALDFPQCEDFLFWEKYLFYFNDLEGWGKIKDSPDSFIINEQKAKDVKFLDEHYKSWKAMIYADRYESAFLQTVASETKSLIKEITSLSRERGEGGNHRKYIEKALILNSKYIYFQVREYYEEIKANEELMDFCGEKLVIDHFAYTHILLRHYSSNTKFGRQGKSYHTDQEIDFKEIPAIILELLKSCSDRNLTASFQGDHIFFNLRGKDYALWFRRINRSIKGGTEKILRVQTFYPIESPYELSKLKELQQTPIIDDLAFYIPIIRG